MDLLLRVLVYVLIGFVTWLLTTKVKMPPYFAPVIQFGVLALILYDMLTHVLPLPNVLR